MKRHSAEEKFLLAIVSALLLLILGFSTCGRADVVEKIEAEARRQHFSPEIAVAVAMVESSLNQDAIGRAGEIGIYQILPRTAPGADLFDLNTNIRVGIKHLKYWQKVCPTRKSIEFVNCYNSGFKHPKYPLLRPYVKRVISTMVRRSYEN